MFNEVEYGGLSGYKIGYMDWPTTDTITISTDDLNVYRSGDVKLIFDRSNNHTNKLFDSGMVNYQSISVFKDDVFIETLSAKEAIKGVEFYLRAPGAVKYPVQIRFNSDLMQDGYDYDSEGYLLSAFNLDKTITTITRRSSSFKGLPTNEKNNITNFSYVSYSEPLTAGEYEFKFEVTDINNENNKLISSKRLNVETVVTNVWRESLETVVDIITSNPPYPDESYTHLAVLTSADYQRGGWSSDFWGFSARDILNFSGMCWNSKAADAIGQPCPRLNANRVTLITPRHGVVAEHFNWYMHLNRIQAWTKGDHMYFYDHTTGEPVSAIVEDTYRFGTLVNNPNRADMPLSALITEEFINDVAPDLYNLQNGTTYSELLSNAMVVGLLSDIQLIYLDRDVTTGKDIKVYPIATIGPREKMDWPTSKYPLITTGVGNRGNIRRNAVISTNYNFSYDHNKKLLKHLNNGYYNAYGDLHYFSHSHDEVSALSEHIPLNYTGGKPIQGDSGDPTFMLINKELALYTIHSSHALNGKISYGPRYGDRQIIDHLQFFINRIGNTEGYKLSTIQVV